MSESLEFIHWWAKRHPFEAAGAALAGVLLGTVAGWIGWWVAFLIWRYWL